MNEVERQRIIRMLAGSVSSTPGTEAAAVAVASGPRIVSLLPSATEMAFALGLGETVVGVSHECDFPPAARSRPSVVHPALALQGMTQRQIDAAVSQRVREGNSLYEIDEALLQQMRPDLILTQDLCQVCAPSGMQLADTLRSLSPRPNVLAMTPHTVGDILENMRELGRATGREAVAQQLIESYRERLARIRATVPRNLPLKRVFFMEWADPIYSGGHWVPEMVELAGGIDPLARAGQNSARVAWEDVLRWAPELLVVAPCGCDISQALEQLPTLTALPDWSTLPAVQRGQVICVDANSFFARPGPRVVEGVELLAHLINPALFGWTGPKDAYRPFHSGA
jgi:iron complex transport system substrate-binding protein